MSPTTAANLATYAPRWGYLLGQAIIARRNAGVTGYGYLLAQEHVAALSRIVAHQDALSAKAER